MNMTDQKLAELKANALGILSEHRRKLLAQYPFIGSIIMGLDLVPVRDNRLPTAACDGQRIFFSIDFLRTLKPEEAKFILAHEVYHAVLAHMSREAKRNHDLANRAMDVEVNEILLAEGLSCPKDACTCQTLRLPKGHSFEEYYEMLLKSFQQADSGSEGQSGGQAAPSGGNSSPSPEGQFDKHICKGDDMSADQGNPDAVDKYGPVGQDADYQPAVDKNIGEKLRQAVITAAQEYERSRGQLPSHLQNIVKGLLQPEIHWQEVLAQFISKAQGEGRTSWNRPNRRFAASGTYLPSHQGDKIRVGILIDTSGSCTNDLQKFLSEANGIVKSFGNYELAICQCDAEVQAFETFSEDNPFDPENKGFKFHGYGGTQLMPGLQEFERQEADVDCIVAFSDLECEEIPENAVEVPLLWISTTHHAHKNIKCGTVIEFK